MESKEIVEKNELTNHLEAIKDKNNLPRQQNNIKRRSVPETKSKAPVYFGIAFLIFTFIAVGYFILDLLLRNFTPQAIFTRSLTAFGELKEYKYNLILKVAFIYEGETANLNLNDVEAQTLLKRSLSDKHRIILNGDHSRYEDHPEGKYDLVWEIADEKAFTAEGYYQGFDFFYKITPYLYPGVIDEKITDNYQKLNIGELLSSLMPVEDLQLLEKISFDDLTYEVVEAYPDDLINGNKSYHYKVRIYKKDDLEKLLSQVEIGNLDVWITKKERILKKLKGEVVFRNFGSQDNTLDIQYEMNLL